MIMKTCEEGRNNWNKWKRRGLFIFRMARGNPSCLQSLPLLFLQVGSTMYSQNTVSLEAAQVKENTNMQRVKKKN